MPSFHSSHTNPLTNCSNAVNAQCHSNIPIFAKFLIELRTLWIDGIEVEARLIEYPISVSSPLLHKLSPSIRMAKSQIAGINLFALNAAAGNLLRPNDISIDWMLCRDGYVATFAARWQDCVGAAVVMVFRQTCRRPIIRQNNCDFAEVRTTM